MPLKASVTKIEEVPEAQRSLYVERDGKFVLDAEGVEDVTGLKSALQKERDANKELKRLKTIIGDRAPEDLERVLTEAETNAQKAAEASGNVESVKKQLEDKHNKKVKDLEDKIVKQDGFIRKLVAENVIKDEIAAVGGNATLLEPHVLKSVRVKEEGDEYVAIVVDDKGNTRLSTGNSNEPMKISELIAELKVKPEFEAAFVGSGASGSGATPSAARGSGGASAGAPVQGSSSEKAKTDKRRTGRYTL